MYIYIIYIWKGSGKMDEKQYRDNQPGYDTDTFGEVNRDNYKQDAQGYTNSDGQNGYSQGYAQGNDSRSSYSQGNYSQNNYGQGSYQQDGYYQNAQQAYGDGGSFYHSSQPNQNGFGIASMVLGILALVFFCGCINIPLAVISIIFAVIHINRKTGSIGFAIAGIVTSAISVILTVIMIAVFLYAGVGTTSWMYSETLPFEYFMDGDDYFDYDGDDPEPDLPFDGHHGQDL